MDRRWGSASGQPERDNSTRWAGRTFAGGSYRGSFQGELNAFAKLAEREP